VSFQLSILKILAGQPGGRASLDVVKQYLAVFYSSGSDWTARMKGLAARVPDLDIFGQNLIAREPGEWIITAKGRALLREIEDLSVAVAEPRTLDGFIAQTELAEMKTATTQTARADDRRRRRHRRRTRSHRGARIAS
jgi:hypothetical protein